MTALRVIFNYQNPCANNMGVPRILFVHDGPPSTDSGYNSKKKDCIEFQCGFRLARLFSLVKPTGLRPYEE